MALPNQLPVTIDFGTLPQTGAGYDPQQFADRLGLNGKIFTEQQFALFVTGSTAPTSDVGPWLANGNEWRVWDAGTGMYVPITVDQGSLGYFIGNAAPDPAVYKFWIETTVGGSPLALKTYFSGAWVDVYAATLAGYSTTAALNAAIAATLASANAYTDAAIAAIPPSSGFSSYPAQGVTTGGGQSIAIDGNPYKVALSVAAINPAPAPFDTGNNRYTAPATGIYQMSVSTQFDNDTGTPSGMSVMVEAYVNGSFIGKAMGDIDNTPNPNGAWSPGFSGLVTMNSGDYLELYTTVFDGVNTGNITLAVAQMSVVRVSG